MMFKRKEHYTVDLVECKKCCRCGDIAPLDKFYHDVNSWDLKTCQCKDCTKITNAQYQEKLQNNYLQEDPNYVSIEDVRWHLEHQKELDWIQRVGFDRWYWESLEKEILSEGRSYVCT